MFTTFVDTLPDLVRTIALTVFFIFLGFIVIKQEPCKRSRHILRELPDRGREAPGR